MKIAAALFLAALMLDSVHSETQKFKDSINTLAGSTIGNVEITNATHEKISYLAKPPGGGAIVTQALPTYLVKDLTYDDMPLNYRQGLSRIKTAEFDEAIRRIKLGMEDQEVRSWIQPHGKYHLGVAYQTKGSYLEAIKYYHTLIKDHPDDYYVPQAYEAIAVSHIRLGGADNFDKALTSFKVLPQFGELWAMRSREGEAEVLEAKKDHDGAADAYANIIKSVRLMKQSDQKKFQEVLARSYRGIGKNLIASNKGPEAEAKYEELISYCKLAKFPEGMAIAYNGLGDYMKMNGKYEDAALAFLRTSILYGQGQENEDARALFGAAECFNQLFLKATVKSEKEEFRARSLQLFKEVKDKYPATEQGQKAIQFAPPG
ncbi:MAG: tetratricopeptide repeat protein [Planctomycetota bacterium]|nr:tetratricopeptide repeat protein [Planctomycetota bacterium]